LPSEDPNKRAGREGQGPGHLGTPDRAGPGGEARFAAFGDAQYVLMAFQDAWKRKDASDAAGFFAEDAWVQLPHEVGNLVLRNAGSGWLIRSLVSS